MAKKKPSVGPAAPRGLNTPRTVPAPKPKMTGGNTVPASSRPFGGGSATARVLPTTPKRPKGKLPKGGGKGATGSNLVPKVTLPKPKITKGTVGSSGKPVKVTKTPQVTPDTTVTPTTVTQSPDFFSGNESGSAESSAVYPETRDTLSMAQLMQQYGIAASVLANNPSLVEALNRILGVGGGPMITDPALQQAIIMGTSWYRDQTDKQRQFDFFKGNQPWSVCSRPRVKC